jgi:hypothetical protein
MVCNRPRVLAKVGKGGGAVEDINFPARRERVVGLT